MKVESLMTRNPGTCSPDDTMEAAARIMWDRDCGSVPVVDQNGRVIGMITDRDICMAACHQDRRLREIQVSSAMSKEVACCKPSDTVESAEKTMQGKKVRRLPVVDLQGKLTGILSLNDIALEAARERTNRQREVKDSEVAETLSAVCEHHVSAFAASRVS